MSVISELAKKELKKLTLPRFWGQLGVGKWLRERVFHIPEDAVNDVAALAEERAQEYARKQGHSVTPADRWRGVESVQADIVSGRLTGK